MTLEMFKDKNKKWRIRLRASNGKIIMSGEAYERKENAIKTLNSIIVSNTHGFNILEIDE